MTNKKANAKPEKPEKKYQRREDVFSPEELHNKVTALIEVSLRLIEAEGDPKLSPGAYCGFNTICREVLEEFHFSFFKEKKVWY